MSGCNGWVPVTPYGNMPTQERFQFQSQLNSNPTLKQSADYSYGTYELVGPNGYPWRTNPPKWGKYNNDKLRLNNIQPPKVSVPDFKIADKKNK